MFSQKLWKLCFTYSHQKVYKYSLCQCLLALEPQDAVCQWKCSISVSSVDSECGPWIIELLLVLTAVWLGRFPLCVGIRSWNVDLTACNIDEQLKLFISRHSASFSEDLKGKNQAIYELFALVFFFLRLLLWRKIYEIGWDFFIYLAESIIWSPSWDIRMKKNYIPMILHSLAKVLRFFKKCSIA